MPNPMVTLNYAEVFTLHRVRFRIQSQLPAKGVRTWVRLRQSHFTEFNTTQFCDKRTTVTTASNKLASIISRFVSRDYSHKVPNNVFKRNNSPSICLNEVFCCLDDTCVGKWYCMKQSASPQIISSPSINPFTPSTLTSNMCSTETIRISVYAVLSTCEDIVCIQQRPLLETRHWLNLILYLCCRSDQPDSHLLLSDACKRRIVFSFNSAN